MPVVGIATGSSVTLVSRSNKPSAKLTFEVPTGVTNQYFKIPIADQRGNVAIDWGDLGGFVEVTGKWLQNKNEIVKYVTNNTGSTVTYVVKVYGSFDQMRFSNAGNSRDWLVDVELGPARIGNPYEMFKDCSNLRSIKVDADSFGRATTFHRMFYRCTSLGTGSSEVDLRDMDVSRGGSFLSMFAQCTSLPGTTLDLRRWNLQRAGVIKQMFAKCGNGLKVLMYSWALPAVTDASAFMWQSGLDTGYLARIYYDWGRRYTEFNDPVFPRTLHIHFGSSTWGRYLTFPIFGNKRLLIDNHDWSIYDGGRVV